MEVRLARKYKLSMGGTEMPHGLRRRFWLESVFGSITGFIAVVTIFWHDWIETIFGADPDKGSGSAEWLVVVALFAVTVALAVFARMEWRRARLAGA
jgi:tetrahydromethanopterin S-methyltransferase subunit E